VLVAWYYILVSIDATLVERVLCSNPGHWPENAGISAKECTHESLLEDYRFNRELAIGEGVS